MKNYQIYIKPIFKNNDLMKQTIKINKTFSNNLKKSADMFHNNMTKTATTFSSSIIGVFKSNPLLMAVSAIAGVITTAFFKGLKNYEESTKEMKQALDFANRTTVMAGKYNTSPAQVMILEAIAKEKGVQQEELHNALNRFVEVQSTKPDMFKNLEFTGNTIQDFLTALKAINSDKANKSLAMNEIFGLRESNKFTEFSGVDFEKRFRQVRAEITKATNVKDLNALLNKTGDWNNVLQSGLTMAGLTKTIKELQLTNLKNIKNEIGLQEKVNTRIISNYKTLTEAQNIKNTTESIKNIGNEFSNGVVKLTNAFRELQATLTNFVDKITALTSKLVGFTDYLGLNTLKNRITNAFRRNT